MWPAAPGSKSHIVALGAAEVTALRRAMNRFCSRSHVCPSRIAVLIAVLIGGVVGVLMSPDLAWGDDPPRLGEMSGGDGPLIKLGEEAAPCAWPTVVAVKVAGGLCTGTLVHPELVLYAAHCGDQGVQIRFGETSAPTSKLVLPEFCETYPEYAGTPDQGHDWAFCKLAEPVRELPSTPILYGCEQEWLTDDSELAIVGFGKREGDAPSGTKYWAMTDVYTVDRERGVVVLGPEGSPTICAGDSGGPAFLRHPEQGTWHHVGIASTSIPSEDDPGCGGRGQHALSDQAVEWLEAASGVDVTPCFDLDGAWNPQPGCNDFHSAEPGEGYGSFDPWCPGTPAVELSATCGPDLAFGDEQPPTVTIDSPTDGDGFADSMVELDIAVSVVDDGHVREVGLSIDGEVLPVVDTQPPFVFEGLMFPAGTFELRASALDYAGNTGESSTVSIVVGGEGEGEGEGEGDGEASDGTGEADGTGSGWDDSGSPDPSAASSPSEDGCGCSTRGAATPAPFALLCLLLGIRRRS